MTRLLLALAALGLATAPAAAADPPAITFSPEPPSLTNQTTVTFSFSAPGATTVTCTLDGIPVTPCASPQTVGPLRDGDHVFAVHAENPDGAADAQRTVKVDTTAPAAPAVAHPADGALLNTPSLALDGTAEPGATIAVAEGSDARGSAKAADDGTWSLAVPGVSDGSHSYAVTATDAAGNASAPATLNVRVDATPPPAPVVSGGPVTFEFSSAEAGAALACSLDGGGFAACSSPASFSGLAPGGHTLTVRATDEAGNSSSSDYRFSVPAPLPAPAATPSPAAPAAVVPAFRQAVVLRPFKGRTLIRRPGAAGVEELRSKLAVPLGTAVDAHAGVVVITDAPAAGARPESGQFSGGAFTIAQTSGAPELALSGTLRCGHTRTLSAEGAGQFRIRGRFGVATGRGAKWTVQDSCRATTVRVTRGVVAVLDGRTHRTVLVRAGRHYEARPKR